MNTEESCITDMNIMDAMKYDNQVFVIMYGKYKKNTNASTIICTCDSIVLQVSMGSGHCLPSAYSSAKKIYKDTSPSISFKNNDNKHNNEENNQHTLSLNETANDKKWGKQSYPQCVVAKTTSANTYCVFYLVPVLSILLVHIRVLRLQYLQQHHFCTPLHLKGRIDIHLHKFYTEQLSIFGF